MTEQLGTAHAQLLNGISSAAEAYGRAIIDQYESREQELREHFRVREQESCAVIEKLKSERDELLRRLEQGGNGSPKPAGREMSPSAMNIASPPPNTAHVASTDMNWQAAYRKLHAKFTALDSNFKKARDALERRKAERDQWATQLLSLQEKLDVLQGKGPDCATLNLDDARLPPATAMSRPSTSLPPRAGSRDAPEHAKASLSRQEPASPQQDTTTLGSGPTPGSTQSDPTEEQESALPPLQPFSDEAPLRIKQEPSSDSPVVVSARPVRKRKRGQSRDEPPSAKVKIEAEAGSSPVPRLERFMLSSEDGLDLGEVAQRITTPRKPREVGGGDIRPDSLEDHPPPQAMTQAQAGLYVKATPKLMRPSPLTPIDANRRMGTALGKSANPSRRRKDIDQGIGALAEDGVSYDQRQAACNGSVETPMAKNRVDSLLNTPNVGHFSQNISTSVARKSGRPLTPRNDLMMPKPRALPFDKSARGTVQQPVTEVHVHTPATANPSAPPKKRGTVTPQRKLGGLRKKPLSELRLDDFRINPDVNEGIDYAFSDVVRVRSERATLPGCTDPHCCGAEFRALALSQKPNPPLTSEQKREEQKLLEEYLGDHAYQLAVMDSRERSETWVKAKTHELANKFGKHRHRYARMRSPPGFWNADFPSTQELEDEKLEAAERERMSIEERRREAMRANGRWVFRDELGA